MRGKLVSAKPYTLGKCAASLRGRLRPGGKILASLPRERRFLTTFPATHGLPAATRQRLLTTSLSSHGIATALATGHDAAEALNDSLSGNGTTRAQYEARVRRSSNTTYAARNRLLRSRTALARSALLATAKSPVIRMSGASSAAKLIGRPRAGADAPPRQGSRPERVGKTSMPRGTPWVAPRRIRRPPGDDGSRPLALDSPA